jgi:ketosteroid isomerase-like protein
MRTHVCKIILTLTILLVLRITANSQDMQRKGRSVMISKADSILFNSLVTQYAQSINQADTVLASKFWSHTPEVSFISPSGNEYLWSGVKNIYNIFRDNFSARKLSCFNIKYANYGNVAWLEFFWIFDGNLIMNNNTVQTKGRETQIWRKTGDDWLLVHVHYSGMPVAEL